ncbi:uncharacterized protein ISCGN_025786 [Ixodes scapularis]
MPVAFVLLRNSSGCPEDVTEKLRDFASETRMKALIENGILYSPYPKCDIPYCSVYTAVKECLQESPDKIALIDSCRSLTRAEFFVMMKRYAAGFQARGVKLGDRVCVHLSNSVENLVAMFGLVFAGATLVLAKPSLTEKFFDDGQDSSTVPAPSSSTPGGSTQSLPPEPPTTDCAKEVDIDSVEVITGIDADKSVDACLASPPASPAFEYEESPDNILPDPSEEDACPDDSHLQSDGVESHASEGNDLDYSSPESDSDDEEATMMNIDTLPVEELRTSLRNFYRKYRRLKAVNLEMTQLLEESSGKVERLEAALSELRLGHRDAS